jgi:superfamily II DNA or RNA helicase
VADEVHQLGSPENTKLLAVDAGRRLGLSATPERYGDPEGTRRLFTYFGGVIPPVISLMDAVRAGRLVPYEYYPSAVNLTAEEADEWKRVSHDISLEIARQKKDASGKKPLTDRAKLLLIQRSRIAKKADQKTRLADAIIKREYHDDQHWLVYCEDSDQLRDVLARLRASGFDPIEYHSGMPGDREATMAWFRTFGGILVSIKCLDEGVDIPAVSHALILASSQNPRQFIQRRGRVLRSAPGKTLAVIFDAIVVPVHLEDEPEQTALLESELARSLEFAANALNKGAAAELRGIAANVGLGTAGFADVGIEEEDDGE